MALTYLRWNLVDAARRVLELAPGHPTVYAWLSFFDLKSAPDKSKDYLDKALALSPQLVFPFREEEIPLYQWAMAARPESWKPKYYLGLILWGKGRVDEALALFKRCDDADFAPFFLARASLLRAADPAAALADLEKAVKLDGASWRTWHALSDFHQKEGPVEKALATARESARRFPGDVPVQVDLVKASMAADRYEDAAAQLDKIDALPFEGAGEIHGLYVQTHVRLGLTAIRKADWAGAVAALERSKEYPEKLGSGKPYEPDTRLQDYFLSAALEKSGQKDKAHEALMAAADYTLKHPDDRGSGAYFGGLALRRLGDGLRAAEILKKAAPPARDLLDALRALGR
jgi:tetratricopeptide (TPR) repeat protein